MNTSFITCLQTGNDNILLKLTDTKKFDFCEFLSFLKRNNNNQQTINKISKCFDIFKTEKHTNFCPLDQFE